MWDRKWEASCKILYGIVNWEAFGAGNGFWSIFDDFIVQFFEVLFVRGLFMISFCFRCVCEFCTRVIWSCKILYGIVNWEAFGAGNGFWSIFWWFYRSVFWSVVCQRFIYDFILFQMRLWICTRVIWSCKNFIWDRKLRSTRRWKWILIDFLMVLSFNFLECCLSGVYVWFHFILDAFVNFPQG